MKIINSKADLYKELKKGIASLKNEKIYSAEDVFDEINKILAN